MSTITRLFDFPYYQLEHYSIPDALVTKYNGVWVKTSTEEYIAKLLALDPEFTEAKALVLEAVQVLFDKTVIRFFPPEHGGEAFAHSWIPISGFKESMSETWASSQWLVAFWEAPWCLTTIQHSARCAVEAFNSQAERKAIGDQTPGGLDRAPEGVKKALKRLIRSPNEGDDPAGHAASSTSNSSVLSAPPDPP